MTQFINCTADQRLGAGEYFDVTLAPTVPALLLTSEFQRIVTDLWNDVTRYTGMVLPVSNNPAGAGKTTVAMRLRSMASAAQATVGDLSNKLDSFQAGLLGGGPIQLVSIERVKRDRIASKGRSEDLTAAEMRAKKQQEANSFNPWNALTGIFGGVKQVVIAIAVVALVVVIARVVKRD